MYYNEKTKKILTSSEVRQAVYPSCLPKNFRVDQIPNPDIKGYKEMPYPKLSSDLKIFKSNGIVQSKDGNWTQSWSEVDMFDGPDKEEKEKNFLKQKINDMKIKIQKKNRSKCKHYILSLYPETVQRNAALGVYKPKKKNKIISHIKRIIEEENRVFDLLEKSDDPKSVESPEWPLE